MPALDNNDAPALARQRARMWWMLLGVVAGGQLFALWLLCSHQVRVAETRRSEAMVQQMALTDCLQYIPGSTIASCSSGLAPQAQPVQQTRKAAAASATLPVSFTVQ